MSRTGDRFVVCCQKANGIPKILLCVAMVILQGTFLNIFLYQRIGGRAFYWFIYDVLTCGVSATIFVVSFHSTDEQEEETEPGTKYGFVVWLGHQVGVVVRMLVTLSVSVDKLDDGVFWGANTFKTTLALSSAVFILMLLVHHPASPGSPRYTYIHELTGTVVFDLLDTVDGIDVMLRKQDRQNLAQAMQSVILAIASLNLLLPTVPFVALSLTGFGQRRLSRLLVSAHKALLSVAVNLPNLITRLILWHGFGVGISVFVLKNILVIALTWHSFYEHKAQKVELRRQQLDAEKAGGGVQGQSGGVHVIGGDLPAFVIDRVADWKPTG